jgi:hypothetical protein
MGEIPLAGKFPEVLILFSEIYQELGGGRGQAREEAGGEGSRQGKGQVGEAGRAEEGARQGKGPGGGRGKAGEGAG